MKLRAKKDEGAIREEELEEYADGLICLTGGDDGPLAAALAHGGFEEALRHVDRLTQIFGHNHIYVELQRHLHRDEEARNRAAIGADAHRAGRSARAVGRSIAGAASSRRRRRILSRRRQPSSGLRASVI